MCLEMCCREMCCRNRKLTTCEIVIFIIAGVVLSLVAYFAEFYYFNQWKSVKNHPSWVLYQGENEDFYEIFSLFSQLVFTFSILLIIFGACMEFKGLVFMTSLTSLVYEIIWISSLIRRIFYSPYCNSIIPGYEGQLGASETIARKMGYSMDDVEAINMVFRNKCDISGDRMIYFSIGIYWFLHPLVLLLFMIYSVC